MLDLRGITIVSGGQTGADRAALDFAIAHGIEHGGWCPRGRLAEDGVIPVHYQLRETSSRKYSQRTEWNARDSDATVLFTLAPELQGGTALTRALAQRHGKPWIHLAGGEVRPVEVQAAATQLMTFLAEHSVRRLNIAGPRVSQEPGITNFVNQVLSTVWSGENTENL